MREKEREKNKICDKKEGKIIDDFAQFFFFSLTFKGSPSILLIDKVLSYSHFLCTFYDWKEKNLLLAQKIGSILILKEITDN